MPINVRRVVVVTRSTDVRKLAAEAAAAYQVFPLFNLADVRAKISGDYWSRIHAATGEKVMVYSPDLHDDSSFRRYMQLAAEIVGEADDTKRVSLLRPGVLLIWPNFERASYVRLDTFDTKIRDDDSKFYEALSYVIRGAVNEESDFYFGETKQYAIRFTKILMTSSNLKRIVYDIMKLLSNES